MLVVSTMTSSALLMVSSIFCESFFLIFQKDDAFEMLQNHFIALVHSFVICIHREEMKTRLLKALKSLDLISLRYSAPSGQHLNMRSKEIPHFQGFLFFFSRIQFIVKNFFQMCICGYKTYYGMANVVASAKTKRLQKQLFISLVILVGKLL